MRNRPRTFGVLGLGVALCALGAAAVWAPFADATAPHTATQAGIRAFVDPETGQLREATHEDLARTAAVVAPRKGAGIEIAEHPGGMKSAVLDESFMATSVAKIGPDGRVITGCVTSEAEMRAFFDDDAKTPELEVR